MGETVKTFCRNCSALCSMEIDVEDGRMVRARPDGTASPYGAYLCPKGMAAVDFHNGAENRLLHSLKKQPDGTFSTIDAEAALDEIGAKLKALYEEHGPRSIAVYHGTGAYRSVLGNLFERAWVAALDTPNFFSSMTIDQSAKWVTMARMGVMASGRHNFRDADCALLAGGNPVVTHQGAPFAVAETGAPGKAFEAARARGCKIIIVDPRRTETARYADLFIQPVPGHDAELFAAIAHVMLREGWYKAEFVEKFCIQLDELRAALAPFTPEMASARADVPVEQIKLAAKWLGEAKRPLAGSGTGPSMSTHSNTADHMIEVVNVLAGGYRRAGDRIRNPGVLKVKDTYELAVSPTRSFEHEPKCVSVDTGLLVGEFPTALIPREIAADSPDRIRALVCFGGDPLMAVGDPAFARAGFDKLELLVSLDCRMNATAEMADYVIATTQPFERHEISVPGDGSYPEPFVQYTRPVVGRPGAVIDDWEFFWSVSARMGVPLTFKYWNYGLRFQDIPDGLPLSLTDKPDPEDLCRFLAKDSVVPFDEIKANPSGVRPAVEPRFVKPGPPDAPGRLELCPPDVAAELAALAGEAPEQGFGYRLTCRRVLHALNGAFRESKEARRRFPVNYAHMSPEDMAADGIAEGDTIEIASEFGAIRTLAKSEARLRRGVISMTHMFGPLHGSGDPVADGGANVGQLTSLTERVEPINFMPRYSAVPVNVRLVEPA
ncbi:molybdopterin-dependent oxidoreductase [Novosphingobium sp. G106]|uniref:molybdopterin-containing oxidoreductase family protein n=1 Tax=Novosphingobium sp. G106 TaxID=2849500 RepID=UPI001C2CD207|nr:molybdopterin-dependent oxidoreductase [Novosphingobium sp. G106]MBV1687545.1 molybdopterin-dependent oxidoreductase [Novosphingobium sp. G106]